MKVFLLKLIRKNIKISEYSHGVYDIQNKKHKFCGLWCYHNMEKTLIVVHRTMKRKISQYFILINIFLKKKHKSPKIKKSYLPKYYLESSDDTNNRILKYGYNGEFNIWGCGETYIHEHFDGKNIH
jgi:hypothetical protein